MFRQGDHLAGAWHCLRYVQPDRACELPHESPGKTSGGLGIGKGKNAKLSMRISHDDQRATHHKAIGSAYEGDCTWLQEPYRFPVPFRCGDSRALSQPQE
jgi:hypothetical protein